MGEREVGDCIRVVIADDHTLLREGLIQLIRRERDLEVVGEAANGREVLNAVQETHPDVLLLDLVMPEIDRLAILPQIRERSPATKVLILADSFDQELIFPSLRQGAQGYILKNALSADLCKAIRTVHAGEAWVERRVVGHLLAELPRHAQEDLPQRRDQSGQLLSRREAEVARLVAAGYSNKEIAAWLSIGEKTVKSHMVSIFRKLRIRHRLELALHPIQQDILLNNHSEHK